MILYRPYLVISLSITEAAPMYNACMKEEEDHTCSHTRGMHAVLWPKEGETG